MVRCFSALAMLCSWAKASSRLSLTTDYYDNEQAVGFYKSQGYEVMYDFVTYPERRMYRLIKRLK